MKLSIISTSVKALTVSALMIGTFASCENQVVNLSPVDQLTDETAYSTPQRCELAVVGVYEAARSGKYTNGTEEKRGYPLGAASIEQSEMRGEDMVNTDQFFDYTYATGYGFTTLNNTNMWYGSFTAINRANIVIDGIKKSLERGTLTEAEANPYIGECMFLRGLLYHNLLIHFSYPVGVSLNNNYGLPYYLKPASNPETMAENLKIGRSTVAETYALILDDLNNAESYLADGHKANKITRATKGAAIALKTRIYLHMKEYGKVEEESKKLVAQSSAPFSSPIGGYSLTANPETPFTAYANNSESIFSIEFSDADPGAANGGLATMMSCRNGGRHLMSTSPIVFNSKFWTKNDKRRSLQLKWDDEVYYCDKYQDPIKNSAYAPMVRYAEVLLNYAEASYRTGNKALALALLNGVRDRSIGDDTQPYKLSDFTQDKELLEAILWERRIEFAGEGRRWEDIHRLTLDPDFGLKGIPAKIGYTAISSKGVFQYNKPIDPDWLRYKEVSYDNFRFLWPIPIEDMLLNPTLATQQNAGWK